MSQNERYKATYFDQTDVKREKQSLKNSLAYMHGRQAI